MDSIEKNKFSGKRISLILSYVISAAILLYFCIGLDYSSFASELKKTNIVFFPIFFFLAIVMLWVRALRWRLLLPRGVQISTKELFDASCIGFMAILLLPLRAGEFVRPWIISRSFELSFSAAFGSVVIERVFDVLALLCMLGICLLSIEEAPLLVVIGARALTVLTFGILLLMFVAYYWNKLAIEVAEKIIDFVFSRRNPSIAAKLKEMTDEFLLGLKAISSIGELLSVVSYSLLIWFMIACYYQIGLLAFGESPSWIIGNTVSVMIALAIAAPSAPGFLGTFQFGCIVALSGLYAYSREFGLSYSIVMHTYQFVTHLVLGLYVLHRKKLVFSDLSKMKSVQGGEGVRKIAL